MDELDDCVPPLRHIDDLPPVHTENDLRQLWRSLMSPLGFSETTLWWLLFDEAGRCAPVLPQITDLPELPTPRELDGLARVLAQLVGDPAGPGTPCEVAFLRSRPGRGPLTAADRAWAGGLARAMQRHGVRCRPVYVATDEHLTVVAPDDLLRVC